MPLVGSARPDFWLSLENRPGDDFELSVSRLPWVVDFLELFEQLLRFIQRLF
jgi:hypothetical protein